MFRICCHYEHCECEKIQMAAKKEKACGFHLAQLQLMLYRLIPTLL